MISGPLSYHVFRETGPRTSRTVVVGHFYSFDSDSVELMTPLMTRIFHFDLIIIALTTATLPLMKISLGNKRDFSA